MDTSIQIEEPRDQVKDEALGDGNKTVIRDGSILKPQDRYSDQSFIPTCVEPN